LNLKELTLDEELDAIEQFKRMNLGKEELQEIAKIENYYALGKSFRPNVEIRDSVSGEL